MKTKPFILSLMLLAAAAASPAARAAAKADTAPAAPSHTEQTQELLRAFYTEYCSLIAASGDHSAALQKLLDTHFGPEARRKMASLDYMPLIRAQDFNAEAVATIRVAHVDGEWYAAAYLDTYRNACVIVPVKAHLERGTVRITDFRTP